MVALSYSEAMNEVLERLSDVGYEHSGRLVNHAPMAAEALAFMGYTDVLPAWLNRNLRTRRPHYAPWPRWPISPGDQAEWRSALGDMSRVTDWTQMFARLLAEESWRDLLVRWWPRLLPGAPGALGHGAIRTAHAVRAVALAGEDNQLQLSELAHGLGYWAARYAPLPGWADPGPPASPADGDQPGAALAPAEPLAALDELVAANAGIYAATPQRNPIPLVHAVTVPAAVRLVCDHLPAEYAGPSYRAAVATAETIRSYFIAGPVSVNPEPMSGGLSETDLFADAVEIGDEHTIKLAEVAVRQSLLTPDHRYAAAARIANQAISRFLR